MRPAVRRAADERPSAGGQAQGEKLSFLGSNDDGDYYLIDRTLHRFGDNGRAVYVVTNFKTAQTTERGKTYLSEAIQWFLNCDSRKVAFGHVVDYAGAMGNGDTVDEIPADGAPGDDQFHVATPASIEEALLNAACKITPAS